jgi:hypothetical protein
MLKVYVLLGWSYYAEVSGFSRQQVHKHLTWHDMNISILVAIISGTVTAIGWLVVTSSLPAEKTRTVEQMSGSPSLEEGRCPVFVALKNELAGAVQLGHH